MIHFKKAVLDVGIKKHLSVINDFQERIKDMMANDGNVNEEEYDSHAQSHNAETVAEVSLLSDQLQFANHELEELRRLDSYMDRVHSSVEFGTLVTTDKDTFFVSTSIERFFVEGKSIFGLSVQSPLYKEMKGKKVGEVFTYNNITYRIVEIV
jgi:transcription elongation GreA/GreB family factor